MHFPVLAMLFLVTILPISVFGENIEPNSQISKEITDKSTTSKIHPILIKWQLSENPDKFAMENNLTHKENTIGVYIYLSGKEFQSSISSEVDVMSSYEKTVFAFVTSEQLDKLDKLDFVEKVTLPDLARTPPVPKPTPPSQIQEEDKTGYLLWVVIGVIAVGIVVALKYKTSKSSHD